LSGLEELDVGYNRKIATIDNRISKLQSLGTLVLCGNSLMALPDSIGELKGLNSLNVSFNRLGSLPAFLSKVNGR
jgi:Leucine-rich repeat (LRR) protein